MNGLVLWYNPKAHVGMVWCEDQGPLAFLGPEVRLPNGVSGLDCGDALTFSVELRDGVRFVRDIFLRTAGVPGADPAEILAGYHRQAEAAKHLSVVA